MAKKVKPISDLSPEAVALFNTVKEYLQKSEVHRAVDDLLIKDFARLSEIKDKVWNIAKDNEPVWTADSGYTQIEGSLSTYLKLLDKQIALGQLLGVGPVARQKVEGLGGDAKKKSSFGIWKEQG